MQKPIRGPAGRALLASAFAVMAATAAADDNPNIEAQRRVADRDSTITVTALDDSELKSFSSPLVIPGADFRSDGFFPEGYRFWFNDGGPTGDATACMMAPVYPPDGVTLDSFWVSVVDDSSLWNINVALKCVDTWSGDVTTIASPVSSYDGPEVIFIGQSGLSHVVSYPEHAYFLTTCLFSPEIRVFHARVFYTE